MNILKKVHKAVCMTCGKTRLLNSREECFWCWDKTN